jgi:hypothetical protein
LRLRFVEDVVDVPSHPGSHLLVYPNLFFALFAGGRTHLSVETDREEGRGGVGWGGVGWA